MRALAALGALMAAGLANMSTPVWTGPAVAESHRPTPGKHRKAGGKAKLQAARKQARKSRKINRARKG